MIFCSFCFLFCFQRSMNSDVILTVQTWGNSKRAHHLAWCAYPSFLKKGFFFFFLVSTLILSPASSFLSRTNHHLVRSVIRSYGPLVPWLRTARTTPQVATVAKRDKEWLQLKKIKSGYSGEKENTVKITLSEKSVKLKCQTVIP